ncbi:hypothetical protein [Nitrogeniibacter aestuarii]|uniref:hypothetical protein n=1 Tax=Nitrogeniibacter aestuarii TaxID=2815343 RepID=UPI001E44AB33|nr:hypothetical protein [Nitrogeniibacter aestuarii]
MLLSKALNYATIWTGLAATLFFALSVSEMNNRNIADLSGSVDDLAAALRRRAVSQKLDFVSGIIFTLLTVLLWILANTSVESIPASKYEALLWTFGIVTVMALLARRFNLYKAPRLQKEIDELVRKPSNLSE